VIGLRAKRPGNRGFIPGKVRDVSFLYCIQTGSGSHSPFYLPRAKRPKSEAVHSPPYSGESICTFFVYLTELLRTVQVNDELQGTWKEIHFGLIKRTVPKCSSSD
jgi:hypothetical protein